MMKRNRSVDVVGFCCLFLLLDSDKKRKREKWWIKTNTINRLFVFIIGFVLMLISVIHWCECQQSCHTSNIVNSWRKIWRICYHTGWVFNKKRYLNMLNIDMEWTIFKILWNIFNIDFKYMYIYVCFRNIVAKI